MKIDKDQLIEGPFGGNACYEQTFTNEGEEIKTWLCFGSGYSSSTLMKEGSKTLLNLIETSPELYKDLFFTDKNKYVWAPDPNNWISSPKHKVVSSGALILGKSNRSIIVVSFLKHPLESETVSIYSDDIFG